jgi:hypothetical protein
MRNTTESHELDWIRTPLYYQLLDTPHEPAFDDLVQLAAYVCQTPIATITFVDLSRLLMGRATGARLAQVYRNATHLGRLHLVATQYTALCRALFQIHCKINVL